MVAPQAHSQVTLESVSYIKLKFNENRGLYRKWSLDVTFCSTGLILFRIQVLAVIVGLCAGGCASSSENEDVVSRAHPFSYTADSFMQDHIPPYHPAQESTSRPFFLKQCSPTGDTSYFSKSSYFCDDREY